LILLSANGCPPVPRPRTPWSREPSPLRQARLAHNWTLENVVEEIDLRTPGGQSGVTPSMVSGWELGRLAVIAVFTAPATVR
jgi:hypothetical protein